MEQLTHVEKTIFDKASGKNREKKKQSSECLNWTKNSILFQLLYWSTLGLLQNLDVIHIEKNICDNVIGMLMNIEFKTRDSAGARRDLAEMGVRIDLYLVYDGQVELMPQVAYTLCL